MLDEKNFQYAKGMSPSFRVIVKFCSTNRLFTNYTFVAVNWIDVCNFADDTTPFATDGNLNKIINMLEIYAICITSQFVNNDIKLKKDNCQ